MRRRIAIAVIILPALLLAAPAGAQIGAPPPPPPPPPPAVPLPPLAPPPIPAAALQGIYRGDDGSAYYQRVVGNTIVGFGEHPGRDYAFVFRGERSADGASIAGTFWDVAKGSRGATAALTLAVSQGGTRLTVAGGGPLGPVTFDAIAPDAVPWPGAREAGFQETSATDLDGAFAGDDGSRTYVRETGSDAVWVTEAAAGKGVRPLWVSVFVGQRSADGGISGDWWDVPKGTREQIGLFGAASVTNQRRTFVKQLVSGSADSYDRILDPDYRVDLDEMSAAIKQAFLNKVTGFGYAVVKDGKVVRKDGGGWRRLRVGDSPRLAFGSTTENDGGSTGKLPTAALVMRALELRGKTVDQRVEPYLPASWKRGAGVQSLTFRQLLNHTAQLYYPGKTLCSNDPYDCLKQAFENGRTRPDLDPTQAAEYHNIHFTAMRLLLPFLIQKTAMKNLFATEKDTKKRNAGFSKVFRDYTVSTFANAGVTVDFKYVTGNYAWWYDFKTSKRQALPADDSYLRSGSGSLRASAREYGEFLGAIDSGKIVSSKTYAQMKSGYLGFDILGSPGKAGAGLGEYWRKNGGCGGCGSQLVVLPDHVAAFVTWNSGGNAYTPGAETILLNAWRNALD
jgi:CubicO group peptidase (beta-lactamase class C family)